MKNALKTFAILLGLSSLVFVAMPATPVHAAGKCDTNFLSFPTWYRGVVDTSDCSIQSPDEVGGLSKFIWKIALNILEIMLQLVGYVSLAFVIYGGFLYLTSGGSADRVRSGKNTIINALVGLVLSFFSVVIVALVAGNIR